MKLECSRYLQWNGVVWQIWTEEQATNPAIRSDASACSRFTLVESQRRTDAASVLDRLGCSLRVPRTGVRAVWTSTLERDAVDGVETSAYRGTEAPSCTLASSRPPRPRRACPCWVVARPSTFIIRRGYSYHGEDEQAAEGERSVCVGGRLLVEDPYHVLIYSVCVCVAL